MNQLKLKANTVMQPVPSTENVCDQVAIGFGFAYDWSIRWRKFFKPIIERSKAKPKQFNDYFQHSIENRSIQSKVNQHWAVKQITQGKGSKTYTACTQKVKFIE